MAGMKRELPCAERQRQTKKTEGGRLTDGAAQCERAKENPTVVGIVVRQSTNH